jgi:uncharacterized protein YndB with AHSA1/START domain
MNAQESIEIAARREHVFNLLTDPLLIPRWWPIVHSFQPRLGGRFAMGAEGWLIEGEVTSIEQPHTLAYTWRCVEHPPDRVPINGVTNVRVDLEERSDGTLMHLKHGAFDTAEQTETHAGMWRHYLARLRVLAEGTDRSTDSHPGAVK